MLLVTPMLLDMLAIPRALLLTPMVPLSLSTPWRSRLPRLSTQLREVPFPLSLLTLATPTLLATPMLLDMLATLPLPMLASLATLV